MQTRGDVTGILHGGNVDESRPARCAREPGDARAARAPLASWAVTRGDLEVHLSGIHPTSKSSSVLKTSMSANEDALLADWLAFEPIFRALCLATEPSHAYAVLFVDDDGKPKTATHEELRWDTLAPDARPAILPPRSYFGARLRAIAPSELTAVAEPLGAGLYIHDLADHDGERIAAAFGHGMRPIGARIAVLRRVE